MEKKNIIVIGASAGGFEAIKQLTAALPADLDAAIFIVWHMSPDVTGILPQVINREKTMLAANAIDHEPIVSNRIYVAPPDRHLLLEKGIVRITRGPKENRFRPAVDPLFRSAAYIYGARVIGIVLSGALDDGTSGLWTIKNRGGIAIVQEPAEAEVPSMPENAIAAVEVDYRVSIAEMVPLLIRLTSETVKKVTQFDMEEQKDRYGSSHRPAGPCPGAKGARCGQANALCVSGMSWRVVSHYGWSHHSLPVPHGSCLFSRQPPYDHHRKN